MTAFGAPFNPVLFGGKSHCTRTAILLGRNGNQQQYCTWKSDSVAVARYCLRDGAWHLKQTHHPQCHNGFLSDCGKWNSKHDPAVRTETDHEHAKSWAQASGGSLYSWHKAQSISDLLKIVVFADSYCSIPGGGTVDNSSSFFEMENYWYSEIKEVE